MKTTHEIAAELLALPDVPLMIEGWVRDWSGKEMAASMTECDPETAIIWQKPKGKIAPMVEAPGRGEAGH